MIKELRCLYELDTVNDRVMAVQYCDLPLSTCDDKGTEGRHA